LTEARRHDLCVRKERAVLVGLILREDDVDARDPLGELTGLAESAGAEVVGRAIQKRTRVDPSYYIGYGKVQELAATVKAAEADVVIFDNDLSPSQIREIETIIECKVVDRSELILDIFAGRARTHEAKLQVELAQLEYTYPRLTRMWSHLERIGAGGGAGIGTRGPGEQQLEIDRRIVRRKITQLKRGIGEIAKRKEREVSARKKEFTIGLVGYTNAGKSTLMNALTGAGTLVEDRLFATLDTKTRRWDVGYGSSVLLSDTVGFVRDLPHHLVASFKATLEEATRADLLLHVVDASHPRAEAQMSAVEGVLEEIGCRSREALVLFNKIDLIADSGRLAGLQTLYPEATAISARSGRGLAELTRAVYRRMKGDRVEIEVHGAATDGRLLARLHTLGEVLGTEYEGSDFRMRLRLAERDIAQVAEHNGNARIRRLE
jgi:GTP-binding protein HflX